MQPKDAAPQFEWKARSRLVDEVAEVLRERIYAGHYAAGAPLRQEHLAAELQVSRTPLREALRLLEREGLVRSEPGRGVRVISIDLASLLDAYAAREMLDGLAARLAAGRAGEADIADLRANIAGQRAALEASDSAAYTEANVAFHSAILDVAGNDFIAGQVTLIPITAQVFTPAVQLTADRAWEAVSEHERIADAIASGDADAAEREARSHIRRTIDLLRQNPAAGGAGPD
jgi:DNA-binding GntR family transcriptional regulator